MREAIVFLEKNSDQMKPFSSCFFILFSLLFALPTLDYVSAHSPIVIRHDKEDAAYLTLGKEFPMVCKVGKRGGDGTLIAPQWILTAAHVAEGMYRRGEGNIQVFFADSSAGFEVAQVFLHPDFAPMQGTDIALLRLKEAITFIRPADLFDQRSEKGKEIVIVGHGDAKTGKGGSWTTGGKKRAASNRIDKTTRNTIIFDFDAPPDGTELEGTAGRGDSGGPAFIMLNGSPLVAGVSSAGMPGKNGPGTYGAVEHYTRVSSFLDWIRATMDSPESSNSLSLVEAKQLRERPKNMVKRPGPGHAGGPIPGLGLMLIQEGDQIRIVGKADPQVPTAFRELMFRPPSFLNSLNGKSYQSLEAFKQSFQTIQAGASFRISFRIQGKDMTFVGEKL